MLALCMELTGQRVSQYTNFDFNSICMLGDRCFAAGDDGLFEVGVGDVDTSGAGVETGIVSTFELATSDFGIDTHKQLRRVHIGGEITDEMEVFVKCADDYTETVRSEDVTKENLQHGIDFDFSHSCRGRYLSVGVNNVNGGDFSIDSITVVPIKLVHRQSFRQY